MKQIELTKGQVAVVDDEDFEELAKYKWQAAWDSDIKSFYAIRTSPRDSEGKRKTIRMPTTKR